MAHYFIHKLPAVKNYYAGTGPLVLEPPQNILIFDRRSAASLGTETAIHHRFVLICNFRTAGEVLVNEQIHRLEPGSAILVFPHQYHRYPGVSAGSIEWLFLTFETADYEQYGALRNRIVTLTPSCTTLLQVICSWYAGERNADSMVDDAIMVHLTATILCLLLRAATTGPQPEHESAGDSAFVDKANQYVWRNCAGELSIVSVARELSISPSRLRARYRNRMGISLGEYIRQIRIHRAMGLIQGSEMNFKQIAFSCGYHNLSVFGRMFRKATGVTMRTYRGSARKK